MNLEVKHFYQVNDLESNKVGRRHEIDARLLSCVNLEKSLPQFSEVVFTTDFSEDIRINKDYVLWLLCSGAFPNAHEYNEPMTPREWDEYRSWLRVDDIDPEYDFARENLGIFSSTNSENLPQMLFSHGFRPENMQINTGDLGVKYKSIFLLNNANQIKGQARFPGMFEGFSYDDVKAFMKEIDDLMKSGAASNFEQASKMAIEKADMGMYETKALESLAYLISKAFPPAPKKAEPPKQISLL